MINVSLPDGSQRSFEPGATLMDLAESIGPGLAKATVCGTLNGQLVDACEPLTDGAAVTLVTGRDESGLEVIRHSFAHLVGHAAKQLFPGGKMAIGPVSKNVFYYEVYYERPLTPEDLEALEKRVKELVKTDYNVVKEWVSRDRALQVFKERGEPFKQEIIEGRLRTRDKINKTHQFHTHLLNALGYDGNHHQYNDPFHEY